MAKIHVGTMGWGYSDWQGVFYEKGLPARDQLSHYSKVLNSVEIDSTHYAAPIKEIVARWHDSVPEDFVFCAKVPRAITHEMRLRHSSAQALAGFVETISVLGSKLGPLLLQFPADFTRAELQSLEAFVPRLAELSPGFRFAMEFRHISLLQPDVTELLRTSNIAQVAADYKGLSRRYEVTTDFVYMRLLGTHGTYASKIRRQGDRTADLQVWSNCLLSSLDRIKTAYVYCNNDYEGFSPNTCHRIKGMLGIDSCELPSVQQPSLF